MNVASPVATLPELYIEHAFPKISARATAVIEFASRACMLDDLKSQKPEKPSTYVETNSKNKDIIRLANQLIMEIAQSPPTDLEAFFDNQWHDLLANIVTRFMPISLEAAKILVKDIERPQLQNPLLSLCKYETLDNPETGKSGHHFSQLAGTDLHAIGVMINKIGWKMSTAMYGERNGINPIDPRLLKKCFSTSSANKVFVHKVIIWETLPKKNRTEQEACFGEDEQFALPAIPAIVAGIHRILKGFPSNIYELDTQKDEGALYKQKIIRTASERDVSALVSNNGTIYGYKGYRNEAHKDVYPASYRKLEQAA